MFLSNHTNSNQNFIEVCHTPSDVGYNKLAVGSPVKCEAVRDLIVTSFCGRVFSMGTVLKHHFGINVKLDGRNLLGALHKNFVLYYSENGVSDYGVLLLHTFMKHHYDVVIKEIKVI